MKQHYTEHKKYLFIRTAEGTTEATAQSSVKRPSAFSSWTEDILTDVKALTPVRRPAGGLSNAVVGKPATAG